MALALPGAPTAAKKTSAKKRVRTKDPKKDSTPSTSKDSAKDKDKDRDLDSDAELEISAEDLVGADGDGEVEGEGDGDGDGDGDDAEAGAGRKRRRRDDDDDEGAEGEIEVEGLVGMSVRNVKREAKRRREEIFLFRGALDDEQSKRFDAFRSAIIPKNAIKKINKDLYDQNIPNNVVSVVAGMVKVFVADVVETAREIQKHTEDPTGPLRPYHLQLARMQLQEQGVIGAPAGLTSSRSSTGLRPRRPLFRR